MMAIELAPKAPPTKASSNAGTDGASKSGSASHAADKGGQSFLSILGLMDAQTVSPVDAGSAEDGDAAAGLLAGLGGDSLTGVAADGQQATQLAPDPSALLAQLQLAPALAGASQPEPSAAPAFGAARPASSRAGELRADAALGVDAGATKAGSTAVKSGKAALDAAAHAANAANVSDAGAGDSKQASGGQSAEGKFALPESVIKAVREVAATVFRAPEVSTLALGGQREKMQDVQTAHKLPVSDVVTGVPTGTGGAMGVDGVVASADAAPVDGQFAEQVSYWTGGDMHKAELTLDGFGTNPVEVSISMQGKEAHVMFRSDEAQTRDALANASVELKASLDRQGVLLSGVSVGTSNAGDSSQQQSGSKSSGWRAAKVEAAPQEAKVVARPGAAVSSRSIDLFV